MENKGIKESTELDIKTDKLFEESRVILDNLSKRIVNDAPIIKAMEDLYISSTVLISIFRNIHAFISESVGKLPEDTDEHLVVGGVAMLQNLKSIETSLDKCMKRVIHMCCGIFLSKIEYENKKEGEE